MQPDPNFCNSGNLHGSGLIQRPNNPNSWETDLAARVLRCAWPLGRYSYPLFILQIVACRVAQDWLTMSATLREVRPATPWTSSHFAGSWKAAIRAE